MSLLNVNQKFRWSGLLLLPWIAVLSSLAGCSLNDLVGQSKVPAGTTDPTIIQTAEGALNVYYGALQLLNRTGNTYTHMSGLFSDELRPSVIPNAIGVGGETELVIDSRSLFGKGIDLDRQSVGDALFSALQEVRGNIRQARGALVTYAPVVSRAIIGHTYAVEGFAEVLLADLYCSGIPLSTVDFDGDFTLKPGSTTAEVYRHAIVLFDSAIALSQDSVRLKDFARVGKARALAALGDYAGAQQATAEVATDFKYELTYSLTPGYQNSFRLSENRPDYTDLVTISDREGITAVRGVPYVSSDDPRSRVTMRREISATNPYRVYTADKYNTTGTSPIVVASGIEARLIQAEAELAQGSANWLVTLNALRTTCTTADTCPTPAPAGSGKVAGLPPLTDPGTPKTRLALLFEERAYWLFLTGHRQGDMRRLVREYDWAVSEVYPTGGYPRNVWGLAYSTQVNMPTPLAEQSNPLYPGCFNRDA